MDLWAPKRAFGHGYGPETVDDDDDDDGGGGGGGCRPLLVLLCHVDTITIE